MVYRMAATVGNQYAKNVCTVIWGPGRELVMFPLRNRFYYRATACNATRGIAVGILSVRPSVRCVYCDKTKHRTANILIPHETAITLVF